MGQRRVWEQGRGERMAGAGVEKEAEMVHSELSALVRSQSLTRGQ